MFLALFLFANVFVGLVSCQSSLKNNPANIVVKQPAGSSVIDATKNITIQWTSDAKPADYCSILLARQVDAYRQLIPGGGNISIYNGKVTLPSWEKFAQNGDYYYLFFQDPFGLLPTWYAESNDFSVKNSLITTASATPTAATSHTGLTEGAKVGIGIGIGLGVPILAILAGLLFVFAKRRPAPASTPDSAPALAPQGQEYGSPPASYAETPYTAMAHVPSQQSAWVQPDPMNGQYAVSPNELPSSNKNQTSHEMPT